MTIDTSREAVEQINEELSWDDSFGAIELINALLAERDAALAEVARLSTSPDHLALVAAAYREVVRNILGVTILVAPDGISHREGAESVRRQLAGFIETLTPADAEARLTALLRAEYERGVRDAAAEAADWWSNGGPSAEVSARILALLTQEGR